MSFTVQYCTVPQFSDKPVCRLRRDDTTVGVTKAGAPSGLKYYLLPDAALNYISPLIPHVFNTNLATLSETLKPKTASRQMHQVKMGTHNRKRGEARERSDVIIDDRRS